MTYDDLMAEINEALEAGTSLTLQDLTPEAQDVLRAAHPDGCYPIPDLEEGVLPLDATVAALRGKSAEFDAAVESAGGDAEAVFFSDPRGWALKAGVAARPIN